MSGEDAKALRGPTSVSDEYSLSKINDLVNNLGCHIRHANQSARAPLHAFAFLYAFTNSLVKISGFAKSIAESIIESRSKM